MNPKFVSWLRTVVPALWAALVTWLLTLGLPEGLVELLRGGEEFVVAAVLAGVYAGLRALEPHMPAFLSRIMLGSAKEPVYVDTKTK